MSRTLIIHVTMASELVVLARLFSNPTPSPLNRAIVAYQRMDLTGPRTRRVDQSRVKRAKRLNNSQLAHLVERYKAGDTVYQLADQFGIDRRTVSIRLKDQAITLRRQPLTTERIDEMVRLYASGLSAAKVGEIVGVSARSVLDNLKRRALRDHTL